MGKGEENFSKKKTREQISNYPSAFQKFTEFSKSPKNSRQN